MKNQLAALASPIHSDHFTADVDDWRLITLCVSNSHVVFLLGNNGRENWMTSTLTGVDLNAGLVTTKSGSVYRLLGPAGEGEPCMQHLMHVCAVLHKWGLGAGFGVPAFFY